MVLFRYLEKLPLRQKILVGIAGLLVLAGIGILVWGIYTGKIKPQAASLQISNTASVTYQDPLGGSYSAQSNTVLVEVVTGGVAVNTKITLQGKTGSSTSNISIKVYSAGTTTLVFEKSDISTDSSGQGSFNIDNLVSGNYDFVLKAPNFLSVKKTNVAVTGSATIDFGEMLTGDINNDNMVNILDYSALMTTWRKQAGDVGYNAAADLKQDNQINILDYSMMVTNWRKQGE